MKYQKMIYQYLKQNTFFPITGGFYRSNAIEQLKGQLKQIHNWNVEQENLQEQVRIKVIIWKSRREPFLWNII
jgi:hypothetical protein